MTEEQSLRYLLDRMQIQDVIARYARYQDEAVVSADALAEGWSEVFSEDAVLDYTAAGPPFGTSSYRELARIMRGVPGEPGVMTGAFRTWAHMLGLPLADIDGDRAHARTDLLATHVGKPRGDATWHLFDAAVFHDELVRTPAGWRIQGRRLVVHYVERVATLPATVERAQ